MHLQFFALLLRVELYSVDYILIYSINGFDYFLIYSVNENQYSYLCNSVARQVSRQKFYTKLFSSFRRNRVDQGLAVW